MCVHMSPGTEGVVDAKLVPVLVGKLLKEEDEIKVDFVVQCIRKILREGPLASHAGLFRGARSSNQIFQVH